MPNRDYPLAPTPNPTQKDKGKGKNNKLPSGATSASAESDYSKAEAIQKRLKNLSGKDVFDMNQKGEGPRVLYQRADSLNKEGDRKTKATGGVIKKYRF